MTLGLLLAFSAAPATSDAVVIGPNFALTDSLTYSSNEPRVVTQGPLMLATWRGDGLMAAASKDGGVTWQTTSPIPWQSGSGAWGSCAGDAGAFYVAAATWTCTPDPYDNCSFTFYIQVLEGRYNGAAFGWQSLALIPTAAPSNEIAIEFDQGSRNLYVVFPHADSMARNTDLTFIRSTDQGATWEAPQQLTGAGASGGRIVVGPDGEILVVWESYLLGTLQARRSTNLGLSFGSEYTIGPIRDNVGTDPQAWQGNYARTRPGDAIAIFNGGLTAHPPAPVAMAVDRTTGPRRGTVYLATCEFADGIAGPGTGIHPEVEPNDHFVSATEVQIGEDITGDIGGYGPTVDRFTFTGEAGRTVRISGSFVSSEPSPSFVYLTCGDDSTAMTEVGYRFFDFDGSGSVAVITLPSTGRYWLAVTHHNSYYYPSVPYTLQLRDYVADPASVSRDHRDILISSSSDGGVTWGPKVRVSDGPVGSEESFPEVAVDAAGRVHVAWYDRRDAPGCGSEVHAYWGFSEDGAHSFQPAQRVSEVASTFDPHWSWRVGDHLGLAAEGDRAHLFWTRSSYSFPGDEYTGYPGTRTIQGAVINLATTSPPLITLLVPDAGAPGSPVAIHGQNFTAVTAVLFHDQSVPFQVVNDGLITTEAPANARTGTVAVVDPPRESRTVVPFYVAPRISSVLPSRALHGEEIRIVGVNFTAATLLRFNGTPSPFTVVSDTLIETTVPAGATDGPIEVTGPGGSGQSSLFALGSRRTGINLSWDDCGTHGVDLKTYLGGSGVPFTVVGSFQPPDHVDRLIALEADIRILTDANVIPNYWRAPGAISADYDFSQGFPSCASVPLFAAPQISMSFVTPAHARIVLRPEALPGQEIALDAASEYYAFKIVVPRLSSGSCVASCETPVKLELRSIQLIQEPSQGFDPVLTQTLDRNVAYWQSKPPPPPPPGLTFSPAAGAPGTAVTLRGAGFIAATTVAFLGTPAVFTVVSDSVITTTVPDGARTGPVIVTTPTATQESEDDFTVAPVLASFSPPQAPVGALVGIAGYNFVGTTAVTFGGVAATTFAIRTDDLIVATVPSGATSGPIGVTNPGGSDSSDESFLVGPLPPGDEGINLSWIDCGPAGASNQSFACNVNTGPPLSMVASFRPPNGVFQFLGLNAVMTVGSPGGNLPDWWRHGTGECRGTTGMSAGFDFTSGPYTCADFFQGQAAGGVLYVPDPGDPSRARITIQAAVAEFQKAPLLPGTEYYGFALRIARSKSTGAGACAGCATPMCIELNSVQLYQPDAVVFNPRIELPADNTVVSFQGATSCLAVTPVLAALVVTEARFDQVRIAWELSRSDGVTLYRKVASGDWQVVTRLMPGGDHRAEYVDRDVRPGVVHGYRLGINIRGEEVFAGETTVTVPLPDRLELHGLSWSGRTLTASLTLREGKGGSLEVFDLNGRRALSQRLEGLGAGRHEVQVGASLQPGVYFGRLIEGRLNATRRFVVVR